MFRTSPLSTNNIHTEIISIAVNRITSKLQPPPLQTQSAMSEPEHGLEMYYLNHKRKEIAKIHKNLDWQRLLLIL